MTPELLLGHWLDGKALLAGALVLLLAATAPMVAGDRPALRRLGSILAVIGAALVLTSATPWPVRGALLVGWLLALIIWQVAERRPSTHLRWRHVGRLAVMATTVLLLVAEVPYHRAPVLPERTFDTVTVIGDSLSIGIGGDAQMTWPHLLERHHAVTMHNLAMGGATVGGALDHQVPRLGDEPGLVILLIGGNDLLGGTSPDAFKTALAELLDAVQGSDRVLVMFELPTLPGRTHYTGIQRQLAWEFDVHLIPRRHLLRILREPANTTDGIHLTAGGQRAMFELVVELLGDGLAPVVRQDLGADRTRATD